MKKIVEIRTEYIKLDSLLKLAGAVSTGGEAKQLIAAGEVSVDGETCSMRGKKIRPGNIVGAGGNEYSVEYAK